MHFDLRGVVGGHLHLLPLPRSVRRSRDHVFGRRLFTSGRFRHCFGQRFLSFRLGFRFFRLERYGFLGRSLLSTGRNLFLRLSHSWRSSQKRKKEGKQRKSLDTPHWHVELVSVRLVPRSSCPNKSRRVLCNHRTLSFLERPVFKGGGGDTSGSGWNLH